MKFSTQCRAAFRGFLLLSALLPGLVIATTWAPSKVDDPIAKGKKCSVNEPASSGSYIYHWPSKYDQVFWPYIEDFGIWFCPSSGYISFIGEFDELTDAEKARIAPFLAQNYQKKKSLPIEEKLKLLEQTYELRDRNDTQRIHLLRVLAFWYEGLGDEQAATAYRRKALEKIRAALEIEGNEGRRLEYLYVAANYEREFGSVEQSDRDLGALRAAIANVKDEKIKGYSEYLAELAKDTSLIVPGGRLAPEKKAQEEEEEEEGEEEEGEKAPGGDKPKGQAAS